MIRAINYNWYATPDNGGEYSNRTVGAIYNKITCTSIEQHAAQGEGDKWYYLICYSDGTSEMIFNPNQVFFEKDN